MRHSSVVTDKNILSLVVRARANYKTMPRANSRTRAHIMPAGITILGPTIMSLINNLLRRDAILFTANQLR